MKTIKIKTTDFDELRNLQCGNQILLSGIVHTARDAAHKRIMQMIENNEQLPFEIKNSIIYYAGATPTKPGHAVGSIGPTTSSRMDIFTPVLIQKGLIATIGKGGRNSDVVNACKVYKSLYFCAIGGAGALAAKSIESCETVAFDDLGCESIKKVIFKDFPLILAIDSNGNDLFSRNK